jgi:SNF family Na+-dependent transporter
MKTNDYIGYDLINGYSVAKNLQPADYAITIIRILLGLGGVAAFVFLLWGGVQWIMAGGDKDGIEKARKKVIGALIGIAIVFSAYAITYIIRTLFGGFNLEYTPGRIGT